jgi:hypothetical protein
MHRHFGQGEVVARAETDHPTEARFRLRLKQIAASHLPVRADRQQRSKIVVKNKSAAVGGILMPTCASVSRT